MAVPHRLTGLALWICPVRHQETWQQAWAFGTASREACIQRTADDAARNIRANQWRQPTGRRLPRPATPGAHEEHG